MKGLLAIYTSSGGSDPNTTSGEISKFKRFNHAYRVQNVTELMHQVSILRSIQTAKEEMEVSSQEVSSQEVSSEDDDDEGWSSDDDEGWRCDEEVTSEDDDGDQNTFAEYVQFMDATTILQICSRGINNNKAGDDNLIQKFQNGLRLC